VKPRMRSPFASTSTLMKPRVSDNVRDRNTAAIGSFAKCLTSKGSCGAGGAERRGERLFRSSGGHREHNGPLTDAGPSASRAAGHGAAFGEGQASARQVRQPDPIG
jgi:hypothetical protein